MVLLLIVFSLVVYTIIRRALVDQFDGSLVSMAQILAASVEVDGGEIELEFETEQMPDFQRADCPAYYQLWRSDGSVVAKSPLLGADNLSRLEGEVNTPVAGASRDRNGRPERAVSLTFTPRPSDTDQLGGQAPAQQQALTLVVARDASDLHRQLHLLLWLLLIVSTAVITLSLLVAAFVVRQGLRPLNSIAAEIAAIREDALSDRIATASVPTEIVPIKNRLNDLLSRLEDAFVRERRFTADVAHELRTPLAGIRSTVEVTLVRARDAAEYKAALSQCLAIVEDMQRMVDNLLMMARLDAHQVTFHKEQIDLAELVDSRWRPFSEKARERGITFENRAKENLAVNSDRENLAMILSNLMSNAAEYADEAGRIWVDAARTDDSVEIAVSNTGCSLSHEQVLHVFDRFWRADAARREVGTHCGLGLALVYRTVNALGGSCTAQIDDGGVFTAKLYLPG
jgi:two-component system sensor histidine kinase QseC